ncbi:MAG: ABC transporter ATP-binding protein [Thermoprotei archaeon]|nr:MAG: ABC transporter ATP-binding protein [Thermoprotei archaeon]
MLLRAINLKGGYEIRSGFVKAVDGCSLTLSEGEILGIIGESGCGKTTLGKLLMGFTMPPLKLLSGKVLISDIDLYSYDLENRRRFWGSLISMVPQYSMNALNPTIKIKDFIYDFLKQHKRDITREEALEIASVRLKSLNLSPSVLDMYPFELSGGMRQRVVIMISSLLNPKILICDEPTSALDVSTQRVLLELLYNMVKLEKIVSSMIIISHDVAAISQICDTLYVMYAGKIVEKGPLDEVLEEPLHPYTKALISCVLTPEERIRRSRITGLKGAPPNLLNPPAHCRFAARCPLAFSKCKQAEPPLMRIGNREVACWLFNGDER